jgi:hypothetical protein
VKHFMFLFILFSLSFCFVQELVVVYIFLCNFVHLHPCFFIQFVWRRITMLSKILHYFFRNCKHCFLFLSCSPPYVKLLLFFSDELTSKKHCKNKYELYYIDEAFL